MSKFLLLFFTLFLFQALAQKTVKDFQGGPFSIRPNQGAYPIKILEDAETESGGMQILAYGDFNGDKYTDIVAMDDQKKHFEVSLWNHDDGFFNSNFYAELPLGQTIVAIFPADYDQDSNLDILVVAHAIGNITIWNLYIQSYNNSIDKYQFGNLNGTNYDPTAVLNFNTTIVQPTIIDFKGNQGPNLLVDVNGQRLVFSFNGSFLLYSGANAWTNETFSSQVDNETKSYNCISYDNVTNLKFASPHSNAFLDLTGDCRADLFIVSIAPNNTYYFETWAKEPAGKFCLIDLSPMTIKFNSLSFQDFDGSGSYDLGFLDNNFNLHIIYNKFNGNPSSPCGNSDIQPVFSNYDAEETTNNQSATVYNLNSDWQPIKFPEPPQLYSIDQNRPNIMRFGDYDRDGYPDMLLTVISSENTPVTYLLTNKDCTNLMGFEGEEAKSGRCYQTVSILGNGQSNYTTAYASFFDFDEIGSLGFLMVISPSAGKNSTIQGIFNFQDSDCFFLKVLMVNYIPEYEQSFGSLYYGASFECVVSDLSGNTRLAKSNQLIRSSYNGLELPYCYIGLNRTNNYVENLYVGWSFPNENTYQWTPIIPNSQLIAIPTPTPSSGTLDIYVNPTEETGVIILTTIIILILLGLLIIYYHYKEKQ